MYAEFFNHDLSFGPDCGRRVNIFITPPTPPPFTGEKNNR